MPPANAWTLYLSTDAYERWAGLVQRHEALGTDAACYVTRITAMPPTSMDPADGCIAFLELLPDEL